MNQRAQSPWARLFLALYEEKNPLHHAPTPTCAWTEHGV